ncbi:MAG: hypothetical protein WDO70_02555 [Alphaproteobacteria bacterium]
MMTRNRRDYAAASILFCMAYFLAFIILYALWRQIDGDVVVFYDGIKAVAAATALFAFLAPLLMRRLAGLRGWLGAGARFETQFTAIACFALLAYSFIVTIPVVIDRSISVYIISAVAQAGEDGIPLGGLEESFLRGYVDGDEAVKKRLHEQLITGNIVEKDGRYILTARGRFFYEAHTAIAETFNVSRRNIRAVDAGVPRKETP